LCKTLNGEIFVCSKAGKQLINKNYINFGLQGRAMKYALTHRPLTTEVGFSPRPVHLKFVVDDVAQGHVSLHVIQIPAVSIIPPMLHNQLHLHITLIRRTRGQSLGAIKQTMFFRMSWHTKRKKNFFKFLNLATFCQLLRYFKRQALLQIRQNGGARSSI
jgi:hypothetical protein